MGVPVPAGDVFQMRPSFRTNHAGFRFYLNSRDKQGSGQRLIGQKYRQALGNQSWHLRPCASCENGEQVDKGITFEFYVDQPGPYWWCRPAEPECPGGYLALLTGV